MTLIAAMICADGSLLLGADSHLTEDHDLRITDAVKLGRLDDRPLAWPYAKALPFVKPPGRPVWIGQSVRLRARRVSVVKSP